MLEKLWDQGTRKFVLIDHPEGSAIVAPADKISIGRGVEKLLPFGLNSADHLPNLPNHDLVHVMLFRQNPIVLAENLLLLLQPFVDSRLFV